MEKHQTFPEGCIIVFTALISMLLAIIAMSASVKYFQYPSHPSCLPPGGNANSLGAGFPVLFICDDWGGGSPTSSWRKIDYVDVINGGVQPVGFTIDFLFFTLLIWLPFLILIGLYRLIDRLMDRSPTND
jgi:hypothetical protein